MANYLAIRDDIKARLEALADIGVVHGYSRMATDWKQYILRFKDPASDRIKGWEITRKGFADRYRGPTLRQHTFVLNGFLGLKDEDATDEIFQQMVETVCDAFLEAPAGASWQFKNAAEPEQAPAQAPLITERLFGPVLCHTCEIHLSVTERILP